jgi:hypothetical protein
MPKFIDMNTLRKNYYLEQEAATAMPEPKSVNKKKPTTNITQEIKEMFQPLLEYTSGNEVMITNYSDHKPKDEPSYCVQVFCNKIVYQLKEDSYLKRVEYDLYTGIVSNGEKSLEDKPNVKLNLFKKLVGISADIKDKKAMVYIAKSKK